MPPKAKKTKAAPARTPRTPTPEEKGLEARAIERLREMGKNKGYHRLSSRVPGIFSQYRYQETNFNRRNKVYRGLYGVLVYGLLRASSDKFLLYSNDILQVVRDTYPSGDDVDWQLTNRNNRPTKAIEVEDLFEDKK